MYSVKYSINSLSEFPFLQKCLKTTKTDRLNAASEHASVSFLSTLVRSNPHGSGCLSTLWGTVGAFLLPVCLKGRLTKTLQMLGSVLHFQLETYVKSPNTGSCFIVNLSLCPSEHPYLAGYFSLSPYSNCCIFIFPITIILSVWVMLAKTRHCMTVIPTELRILIASFNWILDIVVIM